VLLSIKDRPFNVVKICMPQRYSADFADDDTEEINTKWKYTRCIRVFVRRKFTLKRATKARSSTLYLISALDGVSGQSHALTALTLVNSSGTDCRRELVSLRAGLDGYRKFPFPHRASNSGPSIPKQVTILTDSALHKSNFSVRFEPACLHNKDIVYSVRVWNLILLHYLYVFLALNS